MPPLDAPETWLSQFPERRRSLLANLFYGAVRRGLTVPMAIVVSVMEEVHRRRHGAVDDAERDHWTHVLQVLRTNPAAAQAYAQTVLANEALPREQREQQKAAARQSYRLASMQGKPATQAQNWRLRAEGYAGELPIDRAEASTLIERLIREKHTGNKDTLF